MLSTPFDDEPNPLLTSAVDRLTSEMRKSAPVMAEKVIDWMKQLSETERPEDYFKTATGFPMLLLPWWLEKTIHDDLDQEFQADLALSTVAGYYHIRLTDNVMDGHQPAAREILPALFFFQLQFHTVYQQYFHAEHAFWPLFNELSIRTYESVIQEAKIDAIDRDAFIRISAQKTCGAKIPLAAVCYHHDQEHLIEPWSRFCDALGCYMQMMDDLFDWRTDMARGENRTYVLCEAAERKRSDEGITTWIAREGFDWGMDELRAWMHELRNLSVQLNSAEVTSYLDKREAILTELYAYVAPGLKTLSTLEPILRGRID